MKTIVYFILVFSAAAGIIYGLYLNRRDKIKTTEPEKMEVSKHMTPDEAGVHPGTKITEPKITVESIQKLIYQIEKKGYKVNISNECEIKDGQNYGVVYTRASYYKECKNEVDNIKIYKNNTNEEIFNTLTRKIRMIKYLEGIEKANPDIQKLKVK